MTAEYRNNTYLVSGGQLSDMSATAAALTVVRHALHGDSVSREVVESVVDLVQNALCDAIDYILQNQKVESDIVSE